MLALLLILNFMTTTTIYDFDTNRPAKDWRVVDDVVMGGRSKGHFEVNSNGHGHFYGQVSLENNGGFSSIRHSLETTFVEENTKLVIRLKGDGKRFQFRFKAKADDYYSYIQNFETSGEWQEISLPLHEFYPSFRGRKLDLPNFDQSQIEELAFLIANKKAEPFSLLIDKIELR